MVQAGVYSSLIHYFKALEALGGNPHDGRAVVAKMKEMPTDERPVRQGRDPRRRPQDPSGLSVRGEEAGGIRNIRGTITTSSPPSRRTKPSFRSTRASARC